MVSRMGYPMMGLGISYSLISKTQYPMGTASMNGKDMIMPMVVFTLPVYRKKYTAMQNEAELMKTATSQKYQATSNSLQVEYYQAVQLYQDAQRRIKLYDNQYQLASKSLALMLKSFSQTGRSCCRFQYSNRMVKKINGKFTNSINLKNNEKIQCI
jgi:outer membrane protein TolC